MTTHEEAVEGALDLHARILDRLGRPAEAEEVRRRVVTASGEGDLSDEDSESGPLALDVPIRLADRGPELWRFSPAETAYFSALIQRLEREGYLENGSTVFFRRPGRDSSSRAIPIPLYDDEHATASEDNLPWPYPVPSSVTSSDDEVADRVFSKIIGAYLEDSRRTWEDPSR